MQFKPDFSQTMKTIKPGSYKVRIKSYVPLRSRTGTTSVRWYLEVSEGEFTGVKLTHQTPIEGPGAIYLQRFLQAITPNYVDNVFSSEDFIGKTLTVTAMKENEYGYLRLNPIAVETDSDPVLLSSTLVTEPIVTGAQL